MAKPPKSPESTSVDGFVKHEIKEIERRETHDFNENDVCEGILLSSVRKTVRSDNGPRAKVLCTVKTEAGVINMWLPVAEVYYPLMVKLRGKYIRVTRSGDPADYANVRYEVESRKA